MRPLPCLFLVLTCLLRLAAPVRAQPSRQVAFVSLPFHLAGGLIVLRNLTLNGQKGDFILDTGCEYGLVVEQAAFAGHLRPAPTRGLSSTGSVAQQQLPVTSFQLGATHYAGLTAMATSLANIRPYAGSHLLGIVGYELLRDYEVVIDYAHQRLSCYPLHPARPSARPFSRRDSIAFVLERGKPVASGYLGQTPLRLLLDTGAMSNNLDVAFSRHLAAAVRPQVLGNETLTGIGGQQAAQRAVLPELQLPPTAWRGVPVVLVSLAGYASGRALPYQAILGFPFLSQDVVVSFHYGRQRFYALTPKPEKKPVGR